MHTNIEIAQTYYKAANEKNITNMGLCLHPNAQLISPLATINGKEAVLASATGFVNFLNSLTIRASFGSDDQVMLALHLEFPEPIGHLPSAALITFKDGLIIRNELFFDTRNF